MQWTLIGFVVTLGMLCLMEAISTNKDRARA